MILPRVVIVNVQKRSKPTASASGCCSAGHFSAASSVEAGRLDSPPSPAPARGPAQVMGAGLQGPGSRAPTSSEPLGPGLGSVSGQNLGLMFTYKHPVSKSRHVLRFRR